MFSWYEVDIWCRQEGHPSSNGASKSHLYSPLCKIRQQPTVQTLAIILQMNCSHYHSPPSPQQVTDEKIAQFGPLMGSPGENAKIVERHKKWVPLYLL